MTEERKSDTELLTETETPVGGSNTDSAVKSKRTTKLTEKALLGKIAYLEKERKVKLNKAWFLKETIVGLMNDKHFAEEVKGAFAKFNALCDEAKEKHEILMGLLPKYEVEKHELWFKVKMLGVTDFTADVNKWLVHNEGGIQADSVVNNDEVNVEPHDSISNVQSNTSSKGSGRKGSVSKSSKSSSSAWLQAEAEKAALMARAAAIQEKHALEEQAEQLRRKKEQFEIETELAATAAKLAVLNTSRHGSVSDAHSDGMNSYFKKATTLNPHSETYYPQQKDISHQRYPISNNHVTQGKTLEMGKHENKNATNQANSHQVDLNSSGQQATHFQDNPQVSGDLYSLLQRQNEITALMVQAQNSQFLPQRNSCF